MELKVYWYFETIEDGEGGNLYTFAGSPSREVRFKGLDKKAALLSLKEMLLADLSDLEVLLKETEDV